METDVVQVDVEGEVDLQRLRDLPLVRECADDGDRSQPADLDLVSHAPDGAAGLYSIIGGKATVLRAMAERAADAVVALVRSLLRQLRHDDILLLCRSKSHIAAYEAGLAVKQAAAMQEPALSLIPA